MDAVSSISAVSEETSASTEEANSNMIEQKGSIDELIAQINRFKV